MSKHSTKRSGKKGGPKGRRPGAVALGADAPPPPATPLEKLIASGTKVDEVVLNIDYKIIEHFSHYLYGSPNKAIEELVSNGFDAYAENAFVYLPGRFATNTVIVWDDGSSMDPLGLKDLWLIASSPKDALGRTAKGPHGDRKMIGKFGIGKLASYAVGGRITHLCRIDDDFRLVSIDYDEVHGDAGGPPVTTEHPLSAPIVSVRKQEARTYLESLFLPDSKPRALDDLFARRHWTVAVVGDLKEAPLYEGRLDWVLGNGMPLRPDFRVFVNDVEVASRLGDDAVVKWDFGNSSIVNAIQAEWDVAVGRGEVKGTLTFGSRKGVDPARPDIDVPFVAFPELGDTWGVVRLFDQSLIKGKAAEVGRSYGFFIVVLGRLINPDNEKFLLDDPSFGTFYRSQFVLNVDGLDQVLLADREDLQRNTPAARELAILQHSVYRAARVELEDRDAQAAADATVLTILPTRSREHYREPLTALLMQVPEAQHVPFDFSEPRIERRDLGESGPVAILAPDGSGFQVNASHPYYRALQARFGTGRKAQEFLRIYDLIAVSERLLEGHLYDVGISEAKVKEVLAWREGLFREMAESYGKTPTELVTALFNTSYQGNEVFENALNDILNGMGFTAKRDGGRGKKDVFVYASAGPDSYSLIFEAKGSQGPIPNDQAEVSGAASHRDAAGASHAVIVAREFVGFKVSTGSEPAVLSECKVVGRVSILTVEAMAALYEAVRKFGYPLDVLKDIFVEVESPQDKLKRIEQLQEPTKGFDYDGLLQDVWKRQNEEAQGDFVPYRAVWQSRPAWKGLDFKVFERHLIALETLAPGLVRLHPTNETIHLRQAPDIVVEQMEKVLSAPDP